MLHPVSEKLQTLLIHKFCPVMSRWLSSEVSVETAVSVEAAAVATCAGPLARGLSRRQKAALLSDSGRYGFYDDFFRPSDNDVAAETSGGRGAKQQPARFKLPPCEAESSSGSGDLSSDEEDAREPPINPRVAWRLLSEAEESMPGSSPKPAAEKIPVMPTVRVNDDNQRKTTAPAEKGKKTGTGIVITLLPSDDESDPEQPIKSRDARRSMAEARDSPSDIPRSATSSEAKNIPVHRVNPSPKFTNGNQRKTLAPPERQRMKETGVAKPAVSPANKALSLSPIISASSANRCSDCGRRRNSQPCPKCGSLPAPTPPSSQSDESEEEFDGSEEGQPESTTKRARSGRHLPQCSCQKCGTIYRRADDAFANVAPCPCSQSPGKKAPAPKAECKCGGLPMPKYCIECGCPLQPTGDLCNRSESPKDSKPYDLDDGGDGRNITPLTCPLCRNCLFCLFPGAHEKSELGGGLSENKEPSYTRLSEVLRTCPPCKKCRISPPSEAPVNKPTCRCEKTERERVSQPKICVKCGCPDYSDDDIGKVFERIILAAPPTKTTCRCEHPVYERVSQPKICIKCGCPEYSDDDIAKVFERVIQEATLDKPVCRCEKPLNDRLSQPKICEKCGCPIYSDDDSDKLSDRDFKGLKNEPKCRCEHTGKDRASQPKICSKCGCPVYSDENITKVSDLQEAPVNKSKCLCKHDRLLKRKICVKCGCPVYSDDDIAKVPDRGVDSTREAPTNKSKCLCKHDRVSKPKVCVKCGCPLLSDDDDANLFGRGGNVTQDNLDRDAEHQTSETSPLCEQCASSLLTKFPEKQPTCAKRPVCEPLFPHQNCLKCGCQLSTRNWSPLSTALCTQCYTTLSSPTPHQSPACFEDRQRSHSLSLHQMYPRQCTSRSEFYPPNCTCSTAKRDCSCQQTVDRNVPDFQMNRNQWQQEYAFSDRKPLPRGRNEPNCRRAKCMGRQLYHSFLSAVNLNDGSVGQPCCRLRNDMESDEFFGPQPPCQSCNDEQPPPMESVPETEMFETPGATAEWARQVVSEEDFSEALIWSSPPPASAYDRPSEPMEWHQMSREEFSASAEPIRSCECSQPVQSGAFQASEGFQRQQQQVWRAPCTHCMQGGNCCCRSRQPDVSYQQPDPQVTRRRPVRVRRTPYG